MIPDQLVEVKVISGNRGYWRKLGLHGCNVGDVIKVSASLLPRWSKQHVDVKCDYCGRIYRVTRHNVEESRKRDPVNHKDCCRTCQPVKAMEHNIVKYGVATPAERPEILEKMRNSFVKRYGVPNPSMDPEVQKKKSETLLKHYGVPFYAQTDEFKERFTNVSLRHFGVPHPQQSPIVREQSRKTCLQKYGLLSPLSSPEIREKIKATNLERYGADNVGLVSEFHERAKQTSLERYGVCYPAQSQAVLDRMRETCLEKYGVPYSVQAEIVREKIMQTNLARYGVINPLLLPSVQEKAKQTCFERYGARSPLIIEEFRAKARRSYYKNGNVPTSKPQRHMYDSILEHGYDAHLNYPFGHYFFDVAVLFAGLRIDVEFDGAYWHQDSNQDISRDISAINAGWRVIRFIGKRKAPTWEQIESAINAVAYGSDKRMLIDIR